MIRFEEALAIYTGSSGEQTIALYKRLDAFGPTGFVAMNLFRACKCSERAKVYRGGIPGKGSYRRMAYDRKQWAIDNLCKALTANAALLNITWGWKNDPEGPANYQDILYVEIPTGQVSFHNAYRGTGPEYSGQWDRVAKMAPTRICRWIEQLSQTAVTT